MKEHDDVKNPNPSVASRESVSALIDGEASELDMARVLKTSDESDSLRDYWRRQQQYRSVLHAGSAPSDAIDVSARVRETLAGEKRRFANPLVSMAVAASVTIAVVLGGQQALIYSEDTLSPITAPGAVVQVPGTGAVRASFSQNNLSLPSGQRSSTLTADTRSQALATQAFYNELAQERSVTLSPLHQKTAVDVGILPFIARVAEPKVDQ